MSMIIFDENDLMNAVLIMGDKEPVRLEPAQIQSLDIILGGTGRVAMSAPDKVIQQAFLGMNADDPGVPGEITQLSFRQAVALTSSGSQSLHTQEGPFDTTEEAMKHMNAWYYDMVSRVTETLFDEVTKKTQAWCNQELNRRGIEVEISTSDRPDTRTREIYCKMQMCDTKQLVTTHTITYDERGSHFASKKPSRRNR